MRWLLFYWTSPDPLRMAQLTRLQRQIASSAPSAVFVVNPTDDDLANLRFDRAWVMVGPESAEYLSYFFSYFKPGDPRITLLYYTAAERRLVPVAWENQISYFRGGPNTIDALMASLPQEAAVSAAPSPPALAVPKPNFKPKQPGKKKVAPGIWAGVAGAIIASVTVQLTQNRNPKPSTDNVADAFPVAPPPRPPSPPRPPPPANPDFPVRWIYSPAAGRWFTQAKITVGQFKTCVDARVCHHDFGYNYVCNFDRASNDHPHNCVPRVEAARFCQFIGGRLPIFSELDAEATQNGQQPFPWGDKSPNCAYAVMNAHGGPGCGKGTTTPVCRRPLGDSRSGLCELYGNLMEWTADNNLYGRSFYWDGLTDDYLTGKIPHAMSYRYEVPIEPLRSLVGDHPGRGSNLLVPPDIVGFRCVRDQSP